MHCCTAILKTTLPPQFQPTKRARCPPVMENFEFIGNPLADFAEDQNVNSDPQILGEANFKEFVESYKPDALTLDAEIYPVLKRVAELDVSSITADSGLLSTLDDIGLTLEGECSLSFRLNNLHTHARDKTSSVSFQFWMNSMCSPQRPVRFLSSAMC